ncbi:hypothetical protein LR48_Vigan04g089000 [Vigna angularis]|uniref:Uncharacterized protein n=1 Tax=Phaseolus angularis TaxID=3914 RepID=A0A0L9UDR9_PHAAN|nr:hypothetical protein LR48_Vigan04g089000 [Vigna angularis]
MSIQNKEMGESIGSKRVFKGLEQGKLIWLEKLKNKTAFITSKHAYKSRIINKSQAKAYVQAIKRHITHKKENKVAQVLTQGICVTINSTLKHHDHLPRKEKQGI